MAVLWLPVASALIWALSVPIVSLGIARLPTADRLAGIVAGLFASLVAGILASLALLWLESDSHAPQPAFPWLIIAGLLTFSTGTGLYYVTAVRFDGMGRVAAQFAKVKPLFSALLAVIFLGEFLTLAHAFALAAAAVGIVLIVRGVKVEHYKSGIVLGVLTAASWALGDACVRIATLDVPFTLQANVIMLAAGLMSALVPLLILMRRIRAALASPSFLWFFVLHGVTSFGAAYYLFFKSISINGLLNTVLINAFWPILGLGFESWLLRGKHRARPGTLEITGSALMVIAALLCLYAAWRGS